jgi:hypothetical protein
LVREFTTSGKDGRHAHNQKPKEGKKIKFWAFLKFEVAPAHFLCRAAPRFVVRVCVWKEKEREREPPPHTLTMPVSGAVCSVVLYSNLAYSVTNQVTLALTTPYNVAPNGILLCSTASGHHFNTSSFSVDALEEGGSQFISGTSQTVGLWHSLPGGCQLGY